jgi:probable F420-dependent oxidoreductase
MPALVQPIERWQADIRRLEDLGFSSISISDHFTRGWVMEPIVALTAAALTSSNLRLLTLVLGNDYRHPVLLHKAAATLDVLSGGRVELGIGAGWLASDYESAGMAMDSPAVRVDRLEESLQILKGLFAAEPLSFTGHHYAVRDLQGLPRPVQRPRPPILVGGGGRRVLSLAGREADIVSVHCTLREGVPSAEAATDLSAQRMLEKVDWVRTAARSVGRDVEDLELQATVYLTRVTGSNGETRSVLSEFSDTLAADDSLIRHSPAVLCGTVSECVDLLQERRETYGINYWKLGGDGDAVAPIVARLANT